MGTLRGGSTVGGLPILGKSANEGYIGKIEGNKVVNSSLKDDGLIVFSTSDIVADKGVSTDNGATATYVSAQWDYENGNKDKVSLFAGESGATGLVRMVNDVAKSYLLMSDTTLTFNNGSNNTVWHSGNFDPNSKSDTHSHPYIRNDVDDTFLGKLSVGSTSQRDSGIYGIYDSYKIGHVWSMGTAYAVDVNGANFGNLYGIAYKHTNNTTGGTMAGGHQIVFAQNGTANVAIGLGGNIWASGTIYEGGTALSSKYQAKGTYDNYSSWIISDGTNSESITSGATLKIVGSGASSASYDATSNTLTISSTDTDTNTWRGIHDSPTDGATTTSISSNWAYDITQTINGKLGYQVAGSLDVNAENGTKLFVGSSGTWTNRGTTGHNGSALFSMNTHSGSYYSQLWFDTSGNNFYHRTMDAGVWRSWHKVWTEANFNPSSKEGTITAGTTSQYYRGDKTWQTLNSSAVGLGNVGNYSSSTASTASTHALRDGSGDIHARLFRSEYDTTNSSIGYIMTQVDTASNNYIRPSTPDQVKSALNITVSDVGAEYPLTFTATGSASVSRSGNTVTIGATGGGSGESYFTAYVSSSTTSLLSSSYACDGVNDEVQIQNALNDVSTAGGGTVVLSDGTFNIDAIVKIPSNIKIVGQGFGITKLVANSALVDSSMINIGGDSTTPTNSDNITIEGLRLDCNNSGKDLISIYDSIDILISECLITGGTTTTSGYLISAGGTSNYRINIQNCIIRDSYNGFVLSNVFESKVSNNHFEAISGGFYDFVLYKSSRNIVENNTFFNCSTDNAFYSWGGDGNIISNNRFDTVNHVKASGNNTVVTGNSVSNALNGLIVWSNYGSITGNTVESSTYTGISVDGKHNVISGNNVNNCGEHGIEIYTADHIIVSDNLIQGNSQHGINIDRSSHCRIEGNLISGNSKASLGVYDGIFVDGTSTVYSEYNSFRNNLIRQIDSNGAGRHRYGIRFNSSYVRYAWMNHNDLYNAGYSATWSNSGYGTSTTYTYRT